MRVFCIFSSSELVEGGNGFVGGSFDFSFQSLLFRFSGKGVLPALMGRGIRSGGSNAAYAEVAYDDGVTRESDGQNGVVERKL